MKSDLILKCGCGALSGVAKDVSPSTGNHIACLCNDCQTYARHLKRGKDVLDEDGGTQIFQLTPAQLKLTRGLENLRCLRLTEKGLLRWYASCCNTPVANTVASAKVPFAGVPTIFISTGGESLGPILGRVNGKDKPLPIGLILRSIRIIGSAWLKGKHKPSPFFDADGKPIVLPYVLSPEELEAARLPNRR